MTQYLQSGGNLFFGAIGSLTKGQQAVAAEAAASSSKKKDDGLISEKLMLKLQEKGIPVDVDNFMNKLADIEREIDMGLGVNKRALYSLQAQANRIMQQADYLRKAEEHAEKNESLGEIAVGGRGELFVLDGHKIKSISASEYDINKHGAAMTVGELIEHRKFNPSQVGDTELTRVINDNLGMSQISEYLQKVIATVGSASTTDEAYVDLAGYVGREAAKKPTATQLESLQRVYSIIQQYGPNALFKLKNTVEGRNLEDAYRYIQTVLPRAMKTQLLGRNVAAGNKFETGGEYIHNLIVDALNSSNKTKIEEHISYEDSLNKAMNGGTKGDQNRNLGVLEQLVQGSLGKTDYTIISSKNPNISMTLHGNMIGQLADYNNNIVPKTPISLAIQNSLGPITDINHIMMGDQKISPSMLDSILYNGESVINVWAPVDQNGDVDLDKMSEFQDLLKALSQRPELTTADKNQILQEYGFDGILDEVGNFTGGTNMAQFLVFTGLTSDEVLDGSNLFADKLSNDEKKFELDQIDRIYGTLNKGIKNKDAQIKFEKGWFDFTTDLFKAPVFIKLKPTAQIDVGTFSNKGPLVKTQTYAQQLSYDQARYNDRNQQFRTPSTSLMYE